MKTLLKLIAALLLTYVLLMLSSCGGEEENARISVGEITYRVTAAGGDCVEPDLVVIAIVDENDKFEDVNKFDCDHYNGIATLDAGDILEIRVYSEKAFDKGRVYEISITQNGETETAAATYTGIEYLVK